MTGRMGMRRRLSFLIAASVIGASTLVGADAEAATVVSCGGPPITTSITVANSLHNCPGAGLTVSGDGIVIDLGGNVIDGDDAGTDTGIMVTSFSERVRITNGTVKDFHNGVHFDNFAHHARISRLVAASNTEHGVLIDSWYARISSLEAVDNAVDGLLLDGQDQRVKKSRFTSNGDDGLETTGFAAEGVYSENRFLANGGDGLVVVSSQNEVTENRSIGNGGDGIRVEKSSNVITLNTLRGNRVDGISVTGRDNVIKQNRISGNGFSGVFITDPVPEGDPSRGDNTTVRSNVITYNRLEGIRATAFASDAHVLRNTVTDNGTDGILIEGNFADVIRNVARRNGFGFADGINFGIKVTGSNLDGRENRASANDVADPDVQCFPNTPGFCI
jgi:parallel beta-helix repeat protein